MKNKIDYPTEIDDQARIFLIARIVCVYVVMVIAMAWGTAYYKLALYKGDYMRWPTPWLWTIWFLYYAAPFLLAIIYGIIFRPFGRGFRNLWVTIVAIQLLYSFGVGTLRGDYLQKVRHKARWSRNDNIKINNFAYQYFDRNQDGLKEELKVRAVFDLTSVRPGEYLLDAALVSADGKSGTDSLILKGGETVKIAARADKNLFLEQFSIIPVNGVVNPQYEDVNFRVKFLLSRIINVNEYGSRLLQFTRWSPFLRETDWEGGDRDVNGDWIVLGKLTRAEIFTLRP